MVAGPEAGDQHLARDWPDGEKKRIIVALPFVYSVYII